MKKNQIQALDENAWENPPSDIDACILLGFPSEFISIDKYQYQMQAVEIYVNLQTEKPNGFEEYKTPHIFGKIELGDSLKSVRGMSGGPIFVLKDNKYWVFAIQSRWLPESQFIDAVPVKYLGKFLADAMED
jgi:hypothetical protein